MRTKLPKRSLQDRMIDAETRGNRWLADANAARERGDAATAEKCEERGQFWLDRYNLLAGKSDRPAPKQG